MKLSSFALIAGLVLASVAPTHADNRAVNQWNVFSTFQKKKPISKPKVEKKKVEKKPKAKKKVVRKKVKKRVTRKARPQLSPEQKKERKIRLYKKRCELSKRRKYSRYKKYCTRLNELTKKSTVSSKQQITSYYYEDDNNSSASFFARDKAGWNRTETIVATNIPTQKKQPKRKSWFASDPVTIARRYEGKHARRNRRELTSLLTNGNNRRVDPVRIPWCAAFVNATLKKAGYDGTNSLMARSFLRYGKRVHTPKYGDIVVFTRGRSRRSGHVGFYVGEEVRNGIRYILVLGGNQRKAVNVAMYPKRRLLGYRSIV